MLKTFRISDSTFPFLLLGVCLLTYGVFIPWLGFYWDDWPVILMGKFFGPDAFVDFYAYDRPFSAWTYIVSLPLLGLRPVVWQVFTLLLRFLTGLFFWLILRRLWPGKQTQTAWMAVIFLVHPVFTLQFISVAFSQHWTCAFLYVFSLWAMLNSFAMGRRQWLWLALALGSSILHLWTMEYFLGMEVFRYFLIWLTVEPHLHRRQQWIRMIQRGLPYILVLMVYVIWRLFILQLPQEDPNPVRFLQDLSSQPLTGMLTLIQIILRDLLYMLVRVWANVLEPSRMVLTSRFFWFSVLFAGLVAGLIAISFSRFTAQKTGSASTSAGWTVQAMWVGLLATLLGTLPGWVTYRQVLTEPYGSRIAIPALFGLGILTVALVDWLTQDRIRRLVLLSILCGMAVYSHLYVANSYREAWNIQRDFYWQLSWRLPALEPNTPLLSDSEVVLAAGSYSTTSAINLIYAEDFEPGEFPYWFFNMSERFTAQMERLLAGKNIRSSFRNWSFIGDSEDILLIDNALDGCMQVVSENQPETNELSPLLTQALPQVDLSRVIDQPGVAVRPPEEIFGPEPAHTWCYYYQKASLARQSADWQKVIALGEQAVEEGHQPTQVEEWLLFVDAYVQTGDDSAAERLTLQMHDQDPRLAPLLCAYWSGRTTLSDGFSKALAKNLECVQNETAAP